MAAGQAAAIAPAAPSGASATTLAPNNNTAQVIPDAGPGAARTSVITVANAQTVIRDVDVVTVLPHTSSGDLKITIRSPKGTTVLLTDIPPNDGLGRTNNDWFNNTTFDDSADQIMSDLPLNALAPVGSLGSVVPEGALGAFIGENPNGNWTLTVEDRRADENPGEDSGTLQGWGLRIATMANPAPEIAKVVNDTRETTIPDAGPADAPTTTDISLPVSGQGTYLLDVDVKANVVHSNSVDLEMHLVSPKGTVVPLTTKAGITTPTNPPLVNLYNGTDWDDNAGVLMSRTPYGSTLAAAVPEGALAKLVGENPNGTWKLRVVDALTGDVGTVNGWELQLRTTNGFVTVQPPAPVPDPVQPPVQVTQVALQQFALTKNTRKRTVSLNLNFANGQGTITYSALLTTKVRVTVGGKVRTRTLKRVVTGSRAAGAGKFTRSVVLPAVWKGKAITVRLVVKNDTTTVIRTKTLRRL